LITEGIFDGQYALAKKAASATRFDLIKIETHLSAFPTKYEA